MKRISIFYMYRLAMALRPLATLQSGPKLNEAYYLLLTAETAVSGVLNDVVLAPTLKTSVSSVNDLLQTIKKLTTETDQNRVLDDLDIYRLRSTLANFEAIFGAELEVADAYLVTKKKGHDALDLITQAEVLFPDDLSGKVPEAIADVREAGKCIAFELPTAAAFHLHRVNESVLRTYYDAVTSGAPRPTNRNIGDYLKEMDDKNVGDRKVKSALKDLKDLHRNPVIHPEDFLESIDEAIALLGSVQAVMVHMLKEIP